MADSKAVASVNELTVGEREVIRACISLKMASVSRAAKGEANPAIAELRKKEYAELESLLIRFR